MLHPPLQFGGGGDEFYRVVLRFLEPLGEGLAYRKGVACPKWTEGSTDRFAATTESVNMMMRRHPRSVTALQMADQIA